jgi:hypothetical protein
MKIDVTLQLEDAYVIALGAFDYTVQTMDNKVPKGGSPKRAREAIMNAIKEFEKGEGYEFE